MTALARLALRFRTVTLLVVVLLLAGGTVAVTSLNQELFPSIEVPYLVVTAPEPAAGPAEVAADLAEPIEEVIAGTEGLNHVQSTSLEGLAIVTAEYDFGVDMEAREREVREGISSIELPEGAAQPRIERISPDSFPIYSVAVSGEDETQLQRFVADELEPALAAQEGVGELTVAGGTTEVVSVTIEPAALAAAGLRRTDVEAALESSDVSIAVGGVLAGGTQLPVRLTNDAVAVEDIAAVPLVGPAGAPLRLDDVAEVALSQDGAGATISRLDGEPAITVDVVKTQSANTVETVDRIEAAIDDVRRPSGVEMTTVVNQAPEIRTAVGDMARDAVIGAVLAIVMILLFLRSFRATLVTGVSIPLSLLVAFIVMFADGITLNILTLGALSVAAGRVIDDAIVVLENIHRLLDEGMERDEAVLLGTSQMVPAITASTITTVAVFLPLAFVGGLVGEVFVGFALTVTFALLASLVVAVTVIPVLARTFLKADPGRDSAGDREEVRLRAAYRRPLTWALRHRAAVLVVAVVLLVASVATLGSVPVNLFPAGEADTLAVSVSAPPGTSLAGTSERVAAIEDGLVGLDGVASVVTVVGTSDDALSALTGGAGGSSSADLTVELAEGADVDRLTEAVEDLIDEAGLVGTVTEAAAGAPGGTDVAVQVTGRDFDALVGASEAVAEALSDVDGLEEVETNVGQSRPELVVEVDDVAAAGAGLSADQVAAEVRDALTPATVTTVSLADGERQVVVSTDPAAVAGPDALASLPLTGGTPLAEVAAVTEGQSPTAVSRYDGERSVEVSGTIVSDNIGQVTADVTAAIDELRLPEGVEATTGGASETLEESFSSLLVAMVIAVALVYLAMVSTFGSLLTPLVILLTLPLAAVGAFPALAITGRELGLPAMLGLLMLIGIVVTNAIVMLEFVERLKAEEGLSTHDALVEGAQIRLRPILMTALVTILALVPLALGLSEGALLSASLATVVIGGLFSSTVLTLVVIPVTYSLFDRLRGRFAGGQAAAPALER